LSFVWAQEGKLQDIYALVREERYTFMLVCFESSMVDVPSDTWWLDIGANINVTNSLQKLQSTRKLSNGELKLNMGNSVKVEVE
jgi:hypothetical protein